MCYQQESVLEDCPACIAPVCVCDVGRVGNAEAVGGFSVESNTCLAGCLVPAFAYVCGGHFYYSGISSSCHICIMCSDTLGCYPILCGLVSVWKGVVVVLDYAFVIT